MVLRNLNFNKFYEVLIRKRPLEDATETKLAKVLSTLDLTALGIGSTLGVGVYVLAGEVSKTTAGPAVVLSFLIAAIASVFAGLCYAEFGARVPKAGSAYVYSYVSIGEFIAFVIGWNLILEYAIGSASVVKGLSTYLDSLIDKVMSQFFREHMPMDVDFLGEYPDFFALGVILLFSIGLALGARESTKVNNVFTLLNLSVVLYVIVTGLFKVDASNWSIPSEDVPEGYGEGGFAPYGISGIIKGAAICFYGFIGFDCIATAGEEAKNPKRSIPISIIISLFVIFIAYFSISTVLTMMLPYFLQDENAPLPFVFKSYGWKVAEYIVSIGAIFGLFASLMGAMFPLPRVIYAMASDGLIFSIMGKIHPRFKTPFWGTLIAGTLTGILAAIFNLSQLVSMMSIGTLLAYSMVAACVLLLRFEIDRDVDTVVDTETHRGLKGFISGVFNLSKRNEPTPFTSGFVTIAVTTYCVLCFVFGIIISQWGYSLEQGDWYSILILVIVGLLLVGILFAISKQPRSSKELTFTVPLVPWLPGLSILINIYLMLELDYMTWIRFLVWIIVGLAIYFGFGIRNSKLGKGVTGQKAVETVQVEQSQQKNEENGVSEIQNQEIGWNIDKDDDHKNN